MRDSYAVRTYRLRDTFALLLRETHSQPAPLSAVAERSIRRRIRLRWMGRVGALVVVASLGTATVAGAYGTGGDSESAVPSPIATPTLSVAAATFPLAGGQEFLPASSELRCGDPAPTPHSADHGMSLLVAVTEPWTLGPGEGRTVDLATAFLSQTGTTDMGDLATSGIDFLVVQDGIIRGVYQGEGVTLGGSFAPAMSSPSGNQVPLIADWVRCPPLRTSTEAGLEPGPYELIAITRVFSTPESVALSQVFGLAYQTWNLNAENLDDPHAIYLPGSYDCEQVLAQQMAPSRGCLPDMTHDAVVDKEAGTVTVFYKPEGLVEEFSTVLVSQPLTVTLESAAYAGFDYSRYGEGVTYFESIDSLTCGASASGVYVGADAKYQIEARYESVALNVAQQGQSLLGTVFARDAPDGSTVELLPGGRLVWFKDSEIVSADGTWNSTMSTVIGWADVTSKGAVTADRFAGPQDAMFAMDAATVCPGSEADVGRAGFHSALAGQWQVTSPDGTVTTVESATDPQFAYIYGG